MKIYKIIFLLFFISFSVNASETDDNTGSFFLSSDLGTVKTSYNYQGDKLIYHIHDAHCKADAQLNISNIIENIINRHNCAVIAIEGAAGPIYAENFRQFPDKEVLNDVSKYFLDKGFISGSEYYFLNSKETMPFIGIENPGVYKENYELIVKSIHVQPEAVAAADFIISEQLKSADSLFSDSMKEFLNHWIAYNNHELMLDDYVDYLISILPENNNYGLLTKFRKIINEEKKIDFTVVERQRLKFLDWITSQADKDTIKEIFKFDIRYKLNKISSKSYFKKFISWVNEYKKDSISEEYYELKKYTDLLFESEHIDKANLYAELNEAINESAHIVFSNDKDFSVFELIQRTHFYKSLISLSINYEKFMSLSEKSGFDIYNTDLKLLFPQISVGSASMEFFKQAVDVSFMFYHHALEREGYMVENCLNEMEKRQFNVGIIVTGGFHEQGISRELKNRKISFCSIEPSIKNSSVETSYFSLVQNLRSPLENWVAGSTLAVASWIAESPLVDDGIKEIRTNIFSSMLTADYVRKLSPDNVEQIKDQLDLLVDKTNSYLKGWLNSHAPAIALDSVELLGNKLAVHVNVGNRKLVYLFSEPQLPGNVLVSRSDTLEKGKIAQYQVEALAEEIVVKLRQLARAEQISGKNSYSQEDVNNIVERLGLQTELENNQLSLRLIDSAVKDYNYKHDKKLDLSNVYQLYKYAVDDFLISDDVDSLSVLTGEALDSSKIAELTPQDLLDECYDMLRNSYREKPVIKIADLNSKWKDVLLSRGISDIFVDPTLPFESLVSMMFSLAFFAEIEPGIMYLGDMNGERYFIRVIRQTDGTLFARVGHKNMSSIASPFLSEAEYQRQSQLPLPLEEGLITLEVDGGFVISSVIKIDRNTLTTTKTGIRASINGVMRGDEGASQLRELLLKHRREAIEEGLYPTGFVIRSQENQPMYFSDINSLLTYFREIKGGTYEPVRQSDWTRTAGGFNYTEFHEISKSNSIRYSDVVDPVNLFDQLEEYIPVEGRRILDVGSQTGQNVFYFYMKGAEFSVGLDFNPYNVMIAREISAYIHEDEPVKAGSTRYDGHTISEFAVMEGGSSQGHLYFRTLALKADEAETNRIIAQDPPDNLEFAIGDARHIQYPADSFDISNAVNLLHYIDNASLALKEMMRVTRSGGYIQFNYGASHNDNLDLVEEAVRLLERDDGLKLDYEIVEFPNGILPLPLYLIYIKGKSPLLDLSGEVDFIKNHEYKRAYFENSFDSRPYLGALYPPVDIIPQELNIISRGKLNELHAMPDLSAHKRFNLVLANYLLHEIYGSNVFGHLRNVQIEKGRKSFVYTPNRHTLVINEVALRNPFILLMQMEQTLAGNIELSGIDDLQSDTLYPLYKDLALVYSSLQKMTTRLKKGDLEYLIWTLRSTTNPDTDLEVESLMLANLLAAAADPKIKSKELISKIVDGLISLPKYDYLNVLLPMALQDGELKNSLYSSVVRIAQAIDDKSVEIDNLGYFVNRVAEHASDSNSPLETIMALLNIYEWRTKLDKSTKPLPQNIANILGNRKTARILALYPVAGEFVIEDLIKSYLANPLYPPVAPFLANLSSAEITDIIKNLKTNYSQKPSLILETLVRAQELSKLRTLKTVKDVLLAEQPLKKINDQIDQNISDGNLVADRQWTNFMPYYELLLRGKSSLPDNFIGFTDINKIDEIGRMYPGTGYYVLTELVKAYFKNSEDKSELPFLLDFTEDEILQLIANIDTIIRQEKESNRYNNITSPLDMSATAWVTPRLNNYLIEENGGNPYKIIEVSSHAGLESVEGINALFAEIQSQVEANHIKPGEVVLLKICDYYVTQDESPAHTLILVADKLENIYEKHNITRIRESGAHIGESLFEFKMHFMPEENTIGDMVVVDFTGDEILYDWYIAFGDENARSQGIGSEFLRNYFGVLQFLGLNNITVKSTAHAISTFKILSRELNSEFDESLTDSMVGKHEQTYLKFSGLLFRLGILNEADFNFIQTSTQEKDRIKSILDTAIETALIPGESKTHLFVRKADDLIGKYTRLEKIINTYSTLIQDESVISKIPSIKDDYALIEPLITLSQTEGITYYDSRLLNAENALLNSLSALEERLMGYFLDNPSNVLDPYMDLLDFEPDTRKIFNDINSYFEDSFSYTDMRGNIPVKLNEANLPFVSRMILTRCLPLAQEFSQDTLKQVLLSDKPVSEINDKLRELETVAKARGVLRKFLNDITRSSDSYWREMILDEVLEYIFELGMPVRAFLSAKKDFMDMFLDQPYGAWRLLTYILANNLKDPDATKSAINKLKLLDNERFKLVLDILASSSQARVIRNAFPEFVSLVSKSILPAVNSLRTDFGRFSLLSDDNVLIGADTSLPRNMVLTGFSEQTPVTSGYGLREKAFDLVDLFAKKKIKAHVVEGRVHSEAPVEYFVRTGNLIISVKPYGPIFVESLKDEVQVEKSLLPENTLSFSDEPLLWHTISDKQGLLFRGGVNLTRKDRATYVDISVSAFDIQNNKQAGEKSYLLRIPPQRLIELYYSLFFKPQTDIATLTESYNDIYFGVQEKDGDLRQLNLSSKIFNESFSKILQHLDPEWMMSFVQEEVVNRINSASHQNISRSLTIVPFSNVSYGAKSALAYLQYIQSDQSVAIDVLSQQNEARSDFNIIFFNEVPIGAVEKGNIVLMQDEIHDDLKDFMGQTIIHSMATGVSPLQRSNMAERAVLPLIKLNVKVRNDWIIETLSGINSTNINVEGLTDELKDTLTDVGYFAEVLENIDVTFKIVEGSSRLAERSPALPDGSFTVSIDIDAFRNRSTLGFVLQHVMREVSATNLKGYIAHEAVSLANDLRYFQGLLPEGQSQITSVLRNGEVALDSFAELLSNQNNLSQEDIIKFVLAYLADGNFYPQFSSILDAMTIEDIAGMLSSQLNPVLSERLIQMGYNPVETAVLLTQPDASSIESVMDYFDWINEGNKYGLSQNIIPNIFLGRFRPSDVSDLVNIFYDSSDYGKIKLEDIDDHVQVWAGLFSRLGVESISYLLKGIDNKESRYLFAKKVLETMEEQSGNILVDSFNMDQTQVIEVVYQKGLNNVSLVFSLTGELLSSKEVKRVSYEELLPQLIQEQTELTEHFFVQDMEFLIDLMESMLNLRVDDQVFLDRLETVRNTYADISVKYNSYPRASVLSAPVSRQEALKGIVYQFASDLIGTPLASARGSVDIIPYFDDPDKKMYNLRRSIGYLKEINESIVKFRMMRNFSITNNEMPMMVFKDTFKLNANSPFTLHNFSDNSEMEKALKLSLARSPESTVYSVVCEGKNPAALAWITNLQQNIEHKPDSKIAVVSTVLDSSQLEEILSSTGIDISGIVLLGKEVINAGLEKESDPDVYTELVNLVAVNCDVSQDKLLFLSSEINVVGEFLNHGINILPMPDIKQTPLPIRKKFPSMDIYESAA